MANEEFGIQPHMVYRKGDPKTLEILGMRPTSVDEAIKSGYLPTPMPLTSSGKSVGWIGTVLIEWQRKRLAAAATRQYVTPMARAAARAAAVSTRKKKRRDKERQAS
jgi:predicted DNA-binding transcriptional regulator AlpA